jgi:hypothetical protein
MINDIKIHWQGFETTKEECIQHTELNGYYKKGSALKALALGQTLQTNFSEYRLVKEGE